MTAIINLLLSFALTIGQPPLLVDADSPFAGWPTYKNDSIIRVPATVEGEVGTFVTVKADTETKLVKWASLDFVTMPDGRKVDALSLIPPELLKDSRTALVIPKFKGTFRLAAWTALADTPSDLAITTITVGKQPDPEPGPTPPGPNPPGPVPPTPSKDLRVILVYESKTHMPPGLSASVEEYLNAKCKGGRAGWRRWDKDVDVTSAPDDWKRAWTAAKPNISTVPAVVILDGDKGTVYPMPKDEAALLDLLKKAGG